MTSEPAVTLKQLRRCFDGRIPAVIATASGAGMPNITYLSAIHQVDDERVALSNQFMSKTSRNLAENPRASLLLMDPVSHSEYRLTVRYERTDRRGPVFERLRDDVDKVAALSGMRDVFRLRSADIFRVLDIAVIVDQDSDVQTPSRTRAMGLAAAAELTARLSRCGDLDTLVSVALAGLEDLLGYRHSSVLLLDEEGRRLFTIASHGFPTEGVGSEVEVGDGVAGAAAERCEPVRIGQLRQMRKYSRSVRRSFEREGLLGDGPVIPLPTLDDTESRLAVPAMSRGELIGVLAVDSPLPVAFDEDDEAVLTMVATVIAQMVQIERSAAEAADRPGPVRAAPPRVGSPSAEPVGETLVRFYDADGSVFVDGEYLIRGVAGRILWSIAQRYASSGQVEFTTKELRLDRSLDLPGFRDNLDTRMILLKRRLDERQAPLRLERSGRGRFTMHLTTRLRLESDGGPS